MHFELPIGLDHNGKVLRGVEISPPTGGLLKRLRDTLMSKDRTAPYRLTLQEGVESIEGIQGKPTAELLGKLFFPDVEFIFYCMALLDCSGVWPQVIRTCPNCEKEFKQEIDLSKVTVSQLDGSGKSKFDNDKRSTEFHLSRGVTTLDIEHTSYQDGRIGILTFNDWAKMMTGKAAMGTSMMRSIAAAIVELGPARKGEVSDTDLDPLPMSDIKALERLYNDSVPGVQFPIDVECPHCANQFTVPPIDVVSDFLLRSAA